MRVPCLRGVQVTSDITTFSYAGTDQRARQATILQFEGTLTNPVNGKAIPDVGHDIVTSYFAPDGTFLKVVDNGSRTEGSLLRAHLHLVFDGEGDLVTQTGRDWFPTATVLVDITPVRDALT
jgi:hypothetical protein